MYRLRKNFAAELVLIKLVIIMWLSLPLPVATQCKLQTLNDHSTSHSDGTSNEAKRKILCKTIKEQPTPVEGNVKGNKHKHYHFVSMTQITWPFPCPGCVPAWLSGRLLRNGPGMFEIGDTKYNHWFDGQALLHSFTIINGQFTFYCCSASSHMLLFNRENRSTKMELERRKKAAYPCIAPFWLTTVPCSQRVIVSHRRMGPGFPAPVSIAIIGYVYNWPTACRYDTLTRMRVYPVSEGIFKQQLELIRR